MNGQHKIFPFWHAFTFICITIAHFFYISFFSYTHLHSKHEMNTAMWPQEENLFFLSQIPKFSLFPWELQVPGVVYSGLITNLNGNGPYFRQ